MVAQASLALVQLLSQSWLTEEEGLRTEPRAAREQSCADGGTKLDKATMTKRRAKKTSSLANTRLMRFDEWNYTLLYLSARYVVSLLDTGIALKSQLGEDAFLIPGAGHDLFDVFKRLAQGLSYEALLEALSPIVEDKESFVAELWQRGVVL